MSWHPMESERERKRLASGPQAKVNDAKAEGAISKRSRLFSIIATFVTFPLFWMVNFALNQRKRYYQRLSSYCATGCFVECWRSISGEKPVDSESPIFTEIFDAIDYFFYKAAFKRGDNFGVFERVILGVRYSKWVLRDVVRPDAKRAYRFVRKYRLARIFRR